MHIFIDESGAFLPLDGAKSKWSCVAALAVPSVTIDALRTEFIRVRHQFGVRDGELKGANMTARQMEGVLTLLRSYDVIADACVIDLGHHRATDVEAMKEAQAKKLFEHLTPEHQPSLVAELESLAADIRKLPNQLYVQVSLTIELVDRLLEAVTMYYAQRLPQELGEFHWVIDQKDPAGLTRSERVWKTLILPAMTERSRKHPLIILEGADYSHFDRFTAPLPADESGPNRFGTDIRRVLQEDLRFSDSASEPGLQMIDAIAAALTRALNGTLEVGGWQRLGDLFVGKRNDTLHFVMVTADTQTAGRRTIVDHRASGVEKILRARARPMLLTAGPSATG